MAWGKSGRSKGLKDSRDVYRRKDAGMKGSATTSGGGKVTGGSFSSAPATTGMTDAAETGFTDPMAQHSASTVDPTRVFGDPAEFAGNLMHDHTGPYLTNSEMDHVAHQYVTGHGRSFDELSNSLREGSHDYCASVMDAELARQGFDGAQIAGMRDTDEYRQALDSFTRAYCDRAATEGLEGAPSTIIVGRPDESSYSVVCVDPVQLAQAHDKAGAVWVGGYTVTTVTDEDGFPVTWSDGTEVHTSSPCFVPIAPNDPVFEVDEESGAIIDSTGWAVGSVNGDIPEGGMDQVREFNDSYVRRNVFGQSVPFPTNHFVADLTTTSLRN